MKNYDVLLIEDDNDLCELMEGIIAEEGWSIMTAENGLIAQDLMRTERFRIIISDIKVPNRNGLQLAALAKGSRAHANVPIVLISGHVDAAVAMKAKELRIVDILVKPFDNTELLQKIKSYLHQPAALKVNPLFQQAFEIATKNYLDDILGNNTLVEQKEPSREWGTASEISAFIMFSNNEISGEITFNTTRKVIHKMACATFNCDQTADDDELLVNMTVNVIDRLGTYFKAQLEKSGVRIDVSAPKVQLDFKDQEHTQLTTSLLCIPFATGEKSCRVDFFIKKAVPSSQQKAS